MIASMAGLLLILQPADSAHAVSMKNRSWAHLLNLAGYGRKDPIADQMQTNNSGFIFEKGKHAGDPGQN